MFQAPVLIASRGSEILDPFDAQAHEVGCYRINLGDILIDVFQAIQDGLALIPAARNRNAALAVAHIDHILVV
jgi:hypothetical protein